MKKYSHYLLIVVITAAMVVPGSIKAQKITNALNPEAAGFSSERLKRIDNNLIHGHHANSIRA